MSLTNLGALISLGGFTKGKGAKVPPGTIITKVSNLLLSGTAPSVYSTEVVNPSASSLTLTGIAPTVSAGANQTLNPSAVNLVLSSNAPLLLVSNNITLAPTAGALLLAASAPTISTGGADTYAVGGNSPDVVADFVNEYYRVGGSDSDFPTMFSGYTTRSGLATMVDSDGNIKWCPHNYYLQSQDFNTTWATAASTVTSDATTDAAGGVNGDELVNTTTSTGLVYQTVSLPASKVRIEVEAKASVQDFLIIRERYTTPGGNIHTFFDLTNGTVGTSAGAHTASITSLGSGWYLCAIEFTTVAQSQYSGFLCSHADNSFSGGTIGDSIYISHARMYRSDLGGMVDVPTDMRAASGSAFATYVPTTTAARYLHRRGNHVYNGSSWVNKGIQIETEARTNLLLNSGTLSTQNVTTSATPYTLSFTGTGTVTLSGTSTAGPLVGTGTGENNRVNLTFTPTAGTLTLTVSGTVTNAQLEAGSTPSSYTPTSGSTVTRTADSLQIPAANMSANTTAMSLQIDGTITYADEGAEAQQTFLRWQTDASNYISLDLDTDSTDTGQVNANQAVGGTLDTVVAAAQYTTGVNVAFNIASRHTSGAINVAKDGTAATADTTPASLVDLSARNCELFQDAMGNIGQFRQFDVDLGDSGIATAST